MIRHLKRGLLLRNYMRTTIDSSFWNIVGLEMVGLRPAASLTQPTPSGRAHSRRQAPRFAFQHHPKCKKPQKNKTNKQKLQMNVPAPRCHLCELCAARFVSRLMEACVRAHERGGEDDKPLTFSMSCDLRAPGAIPFPFDNVLEPRASTGEPPSGANKWGKGPLV